MSDERLITVEDGLQLVEDGAFATFEEFWKTIVTTGVAEVSARLSSAISELDAGILLDEPDLINIAAQSKMYQSLIDAADERLRAAQGDSVRTVYWQEMKGKFTQLWQDTITELRLGA